ncbi:MAG: geranylgeranyl reductase family protein [Verrucomicrobia bacterium]|nr:geranylgeranyl reductase family protein [Verrucomicrobiota bacterium]
MRRTPRPGVRGEPPILRLGPANFLAGGMFPPLGSDILQPEHPEPAASCDVAIIGTGPAGSTAARLLAAGGARVLLIDKAALPRYKTCGGGVLGRAYRRLPDAAHGAVEREFRTIALNFLDGGPTLSATRQDALVHMTMRPELDHRLALAARDAGAELVESCPIRRITEHADGVTLESDTRSFHARFVIGADGIHSAVAKAGGWSELPHLAPALEWEVTVAPEDFARIRNDARFDFGVIEAGYAWVFPKHDHLSVGILSITPRYRDLQKRLEEYLARLALGTVVKVERHGWMIPLAPRREPLARGRILLVGDAAGLVDPITAEGISNSLLSGQLAAAALLESRFDPASAARRYLGLLRPAILNELRAARLLYQHPRLRNWAFRRHGQRLADFVADIALGDRGYCETLLNPASYLKLLRK